jgi:flagella basal body P-ring formation protein FlgA
MVIYLLALALVTSSASGLVEKAVKEYVQSNFAISCGEYQFDFKRINYALFPAQVDSIKVMRIGKSSPIGNTVFSFGAFKDGGLAKTVAASIEVFLLVEGVVANAPINVGEQFHDLIVARRIITSDAQMPIVDPAILAGKQAKVYIQPGAMIFPSMCENIPLIVSGDKVNIVVEQGLIKVIARGVAKQKGGKGDLIRVSNLGSNKIIRAEVVDSMTVALK